jgi:hypothetical protein
MRHAGEKGGGPVTELFGSAGGPFCQPFLVLGSWEQRNLEQRSALLGSAATGNPFMFSGRYN